jgi:hypothetical protein
LIIRSDKTVHETMDGLSTRIGLARNGICDGRILRKSRDRSRPGRTSKQSKPSVENKLATKPHSPLCFFTSLSPRGWALLVLCFSGILLLRDLGPNDASCVLCASRLAVLLDEFASRAYAVRRNTTALQLVAVSPTHLSWCLFETRGHSTLQTCCWAFAYRVRAHTTTDQRVGRLGVGEVGGRFQR